jgi:hypothetical protein
MSMEMEIASGALKLRFEVTPAVEMKFFLHSPGMKMK